MIINDYVLARDLAQAYELNQRRGSRVLGGGLWLRLGKTPISTAIDLGALGLDTIQESPEGFSIGAMVTLRQLELHPGLNAWTQGAAARAVEQIVGVQFRNLATVGGSLFGRFGFSDVLTLFLTMDAQVELYRGGLVPLERFAGQQPDRDILVRLHVKKRPGRFVYHAMRASRTDLPVLTCAVSCVEGEYRAAVGARPMRAALVRDGEGLLAGGLTPDSARAFAEYAAGVLPTAGNLRGSAAYRTHLIRVLTRRALLELGGNEDGT